MKKILLRYIFFLLGGMFFCKESLYCFYIDNVVPSARNKKGNTDKLIKLRHFFSLARSAFGNGVIVTNPLALQRAAKDTLKYFDTHALTHRRILAPFLFNKNILSTKKVKETLEYIVSVVDKDKKFRIWS